MLRRIGLVGLAVLASWGTARAFEVNNGVYVGIDGAWNMYRYRDVTQTSVAGSQFNNQPMGPGITISPNDNSGASGGVHVGYLFAPKPDISLGLELGYEYFGKVHDVTYTGTTGTANTKISQSGIDVLGVLGLRFVPDAEVFVKAGMNYMMMHQEGSGSVTNSDGGTVDFNALARGNYSASSPEIQAGIAYHVLPYLQLYAFYGHIWGATDYNDTESTQDRPAALNQVGLGVNFFFA